MEAHDLGYDEVDFGLGIVGKTVAKVWSQFRRFGKAKDTDKPLDVKETTIEVHRFVTSPAKVGYWNSAKINVGNFESLDIGVSISRPCYSEEIDECFRWCQDRVESLMKEEVDAVRKKLAEGR